MSPSADELLDGRVLIVVPHMDDCVLACGGTLAQLSDPGRVHVVYASDGRASPEPVVPWRDHVPDDLFEIRRAEALAAMGQLGISGDRIHFLEVPDGRLSRHVGLLADAFSTHIEKVGADRVLAPFRYDQNPDHIAVHQAVRACNPRSLIEYFVYYRMRLLPGGDLRAFLRPEHHTRIEIASRSRVKRRALDCFTSQTTRFYPWQARPNLTAELLDDVCEAAESFVCDAPPDLELFFEHASRIRMLNYLEPRLKRPKDRALALLRRGLGRNG